MMRTVPQPALLPAFLLTLLHAAVGQCPLQWQPGDPIPSATGDARATTTWDPDGLGPAPAVLVVGGTFGVGAMLTTSLAAFDGATWSALGSPPLVNVTALTTWNGLLVAAGGPNLFQSTVATFDGSTWSVIGSVNGRVNALTVFQGELFAGGLFSQVNGSFMRSIARWNGSTWSEPGGGVFLEVTAMAVFGSLYVGGSISQVGTGSLAVGNLAIWNGTSWSGGATFDAPIRCLAARASSTPASSFLFAGGDFTTVGGTPAVHAAQFNAATGAWTALPGLLGTNCRSLHVRSTGLTFVLHAAIGGVTSNKVWRWSGTAWTSLGANLSSDSQPGSLAFFQNQLVLAQVGATGAASPLPEAVKAHDGTTWQPLSGAGFDDRIEAVTALGNDIVVAGSFRRYGGAVLEHIARGAPGAWQPLGSGIDGVVTALCVLTNGDLVAGGFFTTAGGVQASGIARWNGTAWSALGTGVNGGVRALLALPNGDLIAGGSFTAAGGIPANGIARWNGAAWSALGSGVSHSVYALARTSNGDIIVGGFFATAGGVTVNHIARWNGAGWFALGSGLGDSAAAVEVLPGDHVVAAGDFMTAGGTFTPAVARWNGSSWLAQSTPALAWDFSAGALLALPNGDYFAAGTTSTFGLVGIDANVARHTAGAASQQWTTADLRGLVVGAAARLPNGDLVFGGEFDGAGGLASHNLAVLRPTCPAAVASYGSSCAGSGGANVLTATAPAWTGSTFHSLATGMPANGIAIAVTGFAPLGVPMATVLPQGLPGCTLLASPDSLVASLPIGGVVTAHVALPNTPALGGQSFYHQVAALDFDLAGNLVAVTGTNGLMLTIGVL